VQSRDRRASGLTHAAFAGEENHLGHGFIEHQKRTVPQLIMV